MKIVVLSDHTATRLKEKGQEREKEIGNLEDQYKEQERVYTKEYMELEERTDREIRLLDARIAEEKTKNDLFWTDKRYFRYIFGCIVSFIKTMTLKKEKADLKERLSRKRTQNDRILRSMRVNIASRSVYVSDDEKAFIAGSEGEKKVDDLFMSCPDNFIFIAGYKNFKGEIDRILVCPHGVLAIEIKNLNGRITVIGDSWSIEKYDNYGNLVESARPIQDKGGRSPSEQVNRSADVLHGAEFKRRFPKVEKVARMALCVHPKSKLIKIRGATVDIIADYDSLKDDGWNKIAQVMPNRLQEKRLTDEEIGQIAAFIERDHNYHERKRENRRR
ncbi:MAG: NERD domain-containing protein [Helicobacteraceae bacterium]|jgi:hypothetical protein|nr:NERD domain-containing protein [Helicobacteraceae bacterium]